MATSRSSALLLAVVAMSMLAGASAILGDSGELPGAAVMTVKFVNKLEETITVSFSTKVLFAKFAPSSVVIKSDDFGTLPVNLVATSGMFSTVTIKVGAAITYTIPPSLTSSIGAQTGTVEVTVSSPCRNDMPGILLTVTSTLPAAGGLIGRETCTGPPS